MYLFIHSFVLLLLILFTYLFIAKLLTSLQPDTSNEFIMFNDEDVWTSGKLPTWRFYVQKCSYGTVR